MGWPLANVNGSLLRGQGTCVEIWIFQSSGLLISKAGVLFSVGNLIWTSHLIFPALLTGAVESSGHTDDCPGRFITAKISFPFAP